MTENTEKRFPEQEVKEKDSDLSSSITRLSKEVEDLKYLNLEKHKLSTSEKTGAQFYQQNCDKGQNKMLEKYRIVKCTHNYAMCKICQRYININYLDYVIHIIRDHGMVYETDILKWITVFFQVNYYCQWCKNYISDTENIKDHIDFYCCVPKYKKLFLGIEKILQNRFQQKTDINENETDSKNNENNNDNNIENNVGMTKKICIIHSNSFEKYEKIDCNLLGIDTKEVDGIVVKAARFAICNLCGIRIPICLSYLLHHLAAIHRIIYDIDFVMSFSFMHFINLYYSSDIKYDLYCELCNMDIYDLNMHVLSIKHSSSLKMTEIENNVLPNDPEYLNENENKITNCSTNCVNFNLCSDKDTCHNDNENKTNDNSFGDDTDVFIDEVLENIRNLFDGYLKLTE